MYVPVSTHMPLARHDETGEEREMVAIVSTHMPLARHDFISSILPLTSALFLLTCLLRGMTPLLSVRYQSWQVSTHMPLARHDMDFFVSKVFHGVSTHMPLARHDRMRIF